jgi:signal transduction histidine kinase
VGVFVPLTLRDLMIGDLHHNVLAVLSLIGLVYTLVSGSSIAATLKETYRRRRENAQLIEALQRENQATQQARLQAEQANAAKSRFFAAANHDLRQPLHAVALLAQTLRVHGRKVDIDEVSARIIECVDSLGRIVDELLELSRLDAGKVTPQPASFYLNELVAEVAKTYQPMTQAKGLQLKIESTDVPVLADRALVARVLSNLISNAVRYTQQGEIKVTTARHTQGTVQVMVQDTGIGIAAQDLTRIFDEFYQVGNPARDRRQGLGLGLATVKRLSDLLDLQIQVRSTVGQGSAFEFCLPVSDFPVQPAAPTPMDSQDLLTGKRILVIEDDASARDAMHRLLTAWGCSVATAAGESEVHALIASGFVPEFVLADMRLGGGANGSQVIKALRVRFGMSLPALVVTGDGGTGLVLGTDRQQLTVMRKPVNPMRLRAYLGDAFGHAR